MADPIGYRRTKPGTQTNHLHPAYHSSIKRAPSKPLIFLPHTLSEITGPIYGHDRVSPTDSDLTQQHAGEPIGERIILSGRVLDENGCVRFHLPIGYFQRESPGKD